MCVRVGMPPSVCVCIYIYMCVFDRVFDCVYVFGCLIVCGCVFVIEYV